MRAGSLTLERVSDALPAYPIFPYIYRADRVIGPENAAPLGTTPWWLTSHLPLFAHHVAFFEKRFLADIGLRLRGQAPLSTLPPSSIPIDPGKPG